MSAQQVIPAEAVEVAAKVMLDKLYSDKTLKVDDEDRDIMRAALEAAAPHMLAAAFDDAADAFGEAASWSDGRPSPEQVQRWLHSRANTHRSTQ